MLFPQRRGTPLWHDRTMPGNLVDPVTVSPDHEDATYGRSYLEWKGWQADNFAQLGSLRASYFDAELRRTRRDLNGEIKVLEIGFGNGSFLAYARARGWDAIGTEINGALVETANRSGFHAIHAEALNKLGKGAFDLVLAFDVLEHIPQAQMLAFVDSLAQRLKPGGVLLARFPNADSPFGLVTQNGDLTHLNAIGLGKVRYIARELGMKLVFYGGQAVPLTGGGAMRTIRRFFGLALFKTVDGLVNTIFYPNDHIAFCSGNAVMILQAAPTAPPA